MELSQPGRSAALDAGVVSSAAVCYDGGKQRGGGPVPVKTRPGLTGNQLKLLAMATMTIDHVGAYLLPQLPVLRIIGRLSLPIYAYMIAEGCRHSRNRWRYFLRLLGLGLLCQVVNYLVTGSLYQGILMTFSLAVLLIFPLEACRNRPGLASGILLAGSWMAACFVCEGLPRLLRHTDFAVDYGFIGVMLPTMVFLGKNARQRWLLLAAGLVLLSWNLGGVQWWCLASLPLIGLYNGEKGRYPLGRMFYWYYPAHLAAIYGIGALMAL